MISGRDLRFDNINFRGKTLCYDNYVYAIGGNNYSGERMNIKTKTWTEIKGYGNKLADNLGNCINNKRQLVLKFLL